MIPLRPTHFAAFLAILLLAGCESDAAQLAREVNDARGDCTQEKLKAGDEACIAMMEKFAGMGTSAIQTYIGAVKSLDQALDRMPPASFDTAGFGHPFSTPPGRIRDASGASDYARDSRYPDFPYPDPRYTDPRNGDSRNENGRYADPRYNDFPYPDSRNDGSWYGDPRYDAPREVDPRDYDQRYVDPGYGDRRAGDPRRDYSGYADRSGYDRDPLRAPRRENGSIREFDRVPRPASEYDRSPPARGLLLPPGQRLDRPWLREQDDRYPYAGTARRNSRDEDLRSWRPGDYLPSRPLPADTLRRYDHSDGY